MFKRYDEVRAGDVIRTPDGDWREVELVDIDNAEGIVWIDFTDGQDAYGAEFPVEVRSCD